MPTDFETREKILEEIDLERHRQDDLKASGKFLWTCADLGVSEDRKLSVLTEETGEVAKEIVDYGISRDKYHLENLPFPLYRDIHFLSRIRTELIQVAAVCVAWCESIDSVVRTLKQVTDKETPQDKLDSKEVSP
jgi:NTP pyrophosphatase (non-canonical NTP hydrolase)